MRKATLLACALLLAPTLSTAQTLPDDADHKLYCGALLYSLGIKAADDDELKPDLQRAAARLFADANNAVDGSDDELRRLALAYTEETNLIVVVGGGGTPKYSESDCMSLAGL